MKRKVSQIKSIFDNPSIKVLLFAAGLLIAGYALMTDWLMFPGLLLVVLFALNQQRVIVQLQKKNEKLVDEKDTAVSKKDNEITRLNRNNSDLRDKAMSSSRFVELVVEAINYAHAGASVICNKSEIIFTSPRTGNVKVMTIDGINDKSEYRSGIKVVQRAAPVEHEEPMPTL